VKPTTRKRLLRRKRRIEKRLANPILRPRAEPMFTAANIHYEVGCGQFLWTWV
jgi:hypothetical protein